LLAGFLLGGTAVIDQKADGRIRASGENFGAASDPLTLH
jgi:hypothetical protein